MTKCFSQYEIQPWATGTGKPQSLVEIIIQGLFQACLSNLSTSIFQTVRAFRQGTDYEKRLYYIDIICSQDLRH